MPEAIGGLTISSISVAQERGDGDGPSLPHAHAQQPFIHAWNQPADSNVGVIGLLASVATETRPGCEDKRTKPSSNKSAAQRLITAARGLLQQRVPHELVPGIKESAIKKGSIVVVADKVRHLHQATAVLWFIVHINLHLIIRVPDIKHQHIKEQGGIGWNCISCTSQIIRLVLAS